MATLLVVLGGCSDDGSPRGAGPGPTESTSSVPPGVAWTARTASPTARQEVAAAVLDGKVWMLGGLNASGAVTRVESYDPAADRWSAGPDLPFAVHHPMAAVYRNEVVLVGGFVAAASGLYEEASDRVLALRGGAWVDLPRLRRPRGAGAAAAVGTSLVVFGGRDRSQLVGPTEVFDGRAWADRAPLPTPRDHLAGDSDGQSVYAVGGRLLDPDDTSAAVERYDPAGDRWERLADLPTARGGLGVAVAGGRLVAAGGEDASRTFPQVEALDLGGAGTWSTLPALPTPRHGLAVAAVGSVVLALVGGDKAGVAPTAISEALSLG